VKIIPIFLLPENQKEKISHYSEGWNDCSLLFGHPQGAS
jgi:hypothetical protein